MLTLRFMSASGCGPDKTGIVSTDPVDPMTDKSARDIEIFTEAVQLPTEDRVTFLDRACAGDEDLPGVRPQATAFGSLVDAVHTVCLVADVDGLAVVRGAGEVHEHLVLGAEVFVELADLLHVDRLVVRADDHEIGRGELADGTRE